MKRKRMLSSIMSFIFLFSFLAVTPVSIVSAASNLASGKLPTASSSAFKNLSYATDGTISTSNYADSSTTTGLQWVQLDLGASYNLNDIKLWHYFGDARQYHDVIVMVSNNASFTAGSYTIVYNNDQDKTAGFTAGTNSEYTETSAGLDIPLSSPVSARYVRFYSSGSTVNSYNHYGEIQVFGAPAPAAGNLAANITPTSPSTGWTNLAYVTDSTKSASNYADSATGTGLQYIQINLGASYNISDIKLWHYFGDTRMYHDVIVMVSNNASFTAGSYTIVYSNDQNASAGFGTGSSGEYAESAAGLDIPIAAPVNAQYVRLYSNGSTVNSYNHYGEVEVYGTSKAIPTVTAWPTASGITYGQTLGASTLSGGTASVPGTFAFSSPATVPGAGSNQTFAVTFTPSDTATYSPVSGTAGINVSKATPTVTSWPAASDISAGMKLGDASLTGGTASVPGTFSFSSPATVPALGSGQSFDATFTPTDAANYNSVNGTISINVVTKATPTVTSWPTASDIFTGMKLGDATLTGGTASVPGTFSFSSPSTVPNAGSNQSFAATFTPADTVNYNTVTGTISINVAESTGTNLAQGKVPTSGSAGWLNLAYATDGTKTTANYADSGAAAGLQYIQLDLGNSFTLSYIKLWHLIGFSRQYHDVIVQVSNDPNFSTGVTTVYNNDANNSAGLGAGSDSEYTESVGGLGITFTPVSARYVRLYSNGSSANSSNHYAEIEVYSKAPSTAASGNLAAGKTVTASSTAWTGLTAATNSVINSSGYADSFTATGLQWVQADLGASYDVSFIQLWHYFGDARTYHDIIVQVSNDPTFATGVTTVYSNDANNSAGLGIVGLDSEYAESIAGLSIQFAAANARYVRCYSNGNTVNTLSHVSEIQVFSTVQATTTSRNLALGKPVNSSSAFGSLTYANDGSKTGYADGAPSTGLQWIQIDLVAAYDISYIKLYHYYLDSRTYHDVIVQVSNDPTFATGVKTVYSNDKDNSAGLGAGNSSEYAETGTGLEIAFAATSARYIRCYSNGSTLNAFNHVVEVEAYSVAPSSSAPLSNASSAFKMTTYDGSGQSVHPCVVYFPNGWHGYKYWMGYTPYPYSNDKYENPCIAASNDGTNWVNPGVTNPLSPALAVGHNCDTELVYNPKTDQLYLYWVYTDDAYANSVKMVKSSNGTTWTAAQTVILDLRNAYTILSPTVDYNAETGIFTMWCVNIVNEDTSGPDYFLERRQSTDGINWTEPVTISMVQPGKEIWHIFIRYIPSQKEYWAIASCIPDPDTLGTAAGELYFMKSADGVNWKSYSEAVIPKGKTGAFDAERIYRSCFVYDETTDTFKVWYSASNTSGSWGMGYTSNTSLNMIYNLIY